MLKYEEKIYTKENYMKKDIMYEKEPEEMTDEEVEQELEETFCNERKIEVLEKLPFENWTKEELTSAILSFKIFEVARRLPKHINTVEEYIRVGRYRKFESEWEEYKLSEASNEMIEELLLTERKIIRHKTVLEQLNLEDWNRYELIKYIERHNKHYDTLW